MESSIRELVNVALKEVYGLEGIGFAVEQPKDLRHGDYSTNVALVLAKTLEERPKDIAGKLVDFIKKTLEERPKDITDVTIAGVGFINFVLSKDFFAQQVGKVLEQKNLWGQSSVHKGKHILVEHSSPNLFKPFHIGHVMNNAIGESIKRLANFSGATVTTISYPSDVSLGIAKAVWILIQDGGAERNLQVGKSASKDMEYLGECYVRGTKAYEDNPEIQPEIRRIADIIFKHEKDTYEYKQYQQGKDLNINYFKYITERLGSNFDDFVYESEAGEVGKKIILENIGKVFKESDGAVIYEGEQDGLHTRVFINREGNPTYEAKDTGLMDIKFKRYKPDLSLFITDHEQVEYFKVVLAAVRKISEEWVNRADKTIHRTHGRMKFKGQKMSSRLGGVPLASSLMEIIIENLNDKAPDLLNDIESATSIAIAALKFSILRAAAGKDINFDPETSLSFEGDSGPYLQYSTVRANSILAKAGSVHLGAGLLSDWQTTDLEKILIHFPEVVEHAIQDWSPHFIVTYLLELSQAFNSWYGNTKILDADDSASPYKLALTKAFAQTMANGLNLLGINVPDKM
jgi:arginyl-tRNA synthetase